MAANISTSDETKSKRAILLGKTGHGKSHIGNLLIGAKDYRSFKIGHGVKSETCQIKSESRFVDLRNVDSIQRQMKLEITDTPGLADTEGRSKEFINSIITEMKTQEHHTIILVVEYGKTSKDIYDNMEIIEKSLCGISASSFIVVVNKFPNENKILQFKKINPSFDERKELSIMRDDISKALNIQVQEFIIFRDDDYDPERNSMQIDLIRTLISFSGPIQTSKIRTWDEVVSYYEGVKNGKISKHEALKNEIEQLEIRIKKAEDSVALREIAAVVVAKLFPWSEDFAGFRATASATGAYLISFPSIAAGIYCDWSDGKLTNSQAAYKAVINLSPFPDGSEQKGIFRQLVEKREELQKIERKATDKAENAAKIEAEVEKITAEIQRLENMLSNPNIIPGSNARINIQDDTTF